MGQSIGLSMLSMGEMKMTAPVMVARRQIVVYEGDSWKSQRIPPNFQLWTLALDQLPSVVPHLWHSLPEWLRVDGRPGFRISSIISWL